MRVVPTRYHPLQTLGVKEREHILGQVSRLDGDRRQVRRANLVRAALMATGSLFVIAVAFTRVYLGLHWLST